MGILQVVKVAEQQIEAQQQLITWKIAEGESSQNSKRSAMKELNAKERDGTKSRSRKRLRWRRPT